MRSRRFACAGGGQDHRDRADGSTDTAVLSGQPRQAVSRTTGYQAKVGTQRGLMAAPADGKIVAWSITLGSPGKRQIKFFNDNYGGASLAGISILKPGTRLFHRVTGESPLQSLQPYFGTTVQFPLGTALNVKKGYVIGLTVPSWAPALSLGMGNDTSWRASRAKGACAEPGTQSAQLDLRDLAQYRCLDRTARLTDTRGRSRRRSRRRRRTEQRHAEALEQRRHDLRVELRAGLVAELPGADRPSALRA